MMIQKEDLTGLVLLEENNNMNRLIIIEGPQGTGKTTLANYLRENIPGSNLYRLSGQKEKEETGKLISKKMYEALLDYLEKMVDIPMDLIFDRTFFTEEVYARLRYKQYSFTDVYQSLLDRFLKLNYEIYFINLYLEDTSIYEKRLKREHHNYQAFSVESSIDQQNVYKEIGEKLKKNGVNVCFLCMDDFNKAYDKVNKLLSIK